MKLLRDKTMDDKIMYIPNNDEQWIEKFGHRFNQLQEIEAVLNYLNIQLRKIRRKHFQKYLESYARALSSRDAEKYVDGEDEVIDFETIINEVALLRNKFLGVMKGFDSKNFMMGHIVRLRTAGMEDISV